MRAASCKNIPDPLTDNLRSRDAIASNKKNLHWVETVSQVRGEEEWAAREEARRIEVEGLKAELDAVKRAAECGGIDGKYVCLP